MPRHLQSQVTPRVDSNRKTRRQVKKENRMIQTAEGSDKIGMPGTCYFLLHIPWMIAVSVPCRLFHSKLNRLVLFHSRVMASTYNLSPLA